MRVYEHRDPDGMSVRSHPWTDAVGDAAHRYVDFRAEPARIRTSLEDFGPWDAFAAIETHYQTLAWVNGPASVFESNDCAFNSPGENTVAGMPKALACSGRLMILFRELSDNADAECMEGLKQAFAHAVSVLEPDFPWGAVGVTTVPVRFRDLPGPDGQLGQQLMIGFWAWGDDVAETMAHLDRTLGAVGRALRHVS